VATLVSLHGLDPARTVALDTLFGLEKGRRRVLMCSAATTPEWRDQAWAMLASDGTAVSVIEDSAGFVAQRLVATIVNIASDIAQQQIATPSDIDALCVWAWVIRTTARCPWVMPSARVICWMY